MAKGAAKKLVRAGLLFVQLWNSEVPISLKCALRKKQVV